MAQQINTIEGILKKLTEEAGGDPDVWHEIPSNFSVPQVKIENEKATPIDTVLVFKYFFNSKTGEVRGYLSKVLNDPETKLLP